MSHSSFAGDSPEEIVTIYRAGRITRVQLIDQLSRWPYTPTPATDGVDDLLVEGPGTFEEVGDALDRGLIDPAIYDEILARRSGEDRLSLDVRSGEPEGTAR